MSKNFILQVQCDDRTRMLQSDEQLLQSLEVVLNAFFKTWTAGSQPLVQVLDLANADNQVRMLETTIKELQRTLRTRMPPPEESWSFW